MERLTGDPHPVQDDGQFPGNSHRRLLAANSGHESLAPGLQGARPATAAYQDLGGLIEQAADAGKSSYLRAGLLPRLARDPDFATLTLLRPVHGVLTGPDGIGCTLAPWLAQHGRKIAPADVHVRLFQNGAIACSAKEFAAART